MRATAGNAWRIKSQGELRKTSKPVMLELRILAEKWIRLGGSGGEREKAGRI